MRDAESLHLNATPYISAGQLNLMTGTFFHTKQRLNVLIRMVTY